MPFVPEQGRPDYLRGCQDQRAANRELENKVIQDLVREWRSKAEDLVRNYPPNEQSSMIARVLHRCADQLARLTE